MTTRSTSLIAAVAVGMTSLWGCAREETNSAPIVVPLEEAGPEFDGSLGPLIVVNLEGPETANQLPSLPLSGLSEAAEAEVWARMAASIVRRSMNLPEEPTAKVTLGPDYVTVVFPLPPLPSGEAMAGGDYIGKVIFRRTDGEVVQHSVGS